jgi:hypothetical protein
MSSFDWESFLKQWSQKILESIDHHQEKLPPEVIESAWLGYPGATEAEIARAEARLGITLPPSYRAFLKVSNGWRQTTPFINKLWSIKEIEWFNVRHSDWIHTLIEKTGHPSTDSLNASILPPSITNEEYFVYGDAQDCSKVRVEYLQTALEISKCEEAAIYLLNPQVITEDGEWEAWFLGDWLPGADRYPSFQAMMQAEYESFLDLREPPNHVVAPASGNEAEATNAPSTADMSFQAMVTAPQETSFSERVNCHHAESANQQEWQNLASFTIEFQSRNMNKQIEERTVIRHTETNTVETYSGIHTEIIQQYMSAQLNTVTHPRSPEEAIALKITQLRIIRAPGMETMMAVDDTYSVFPDALEQGEPFTLEAMINVVGVAPANLEQPLICRAQCFAYHLATSLRVELGNAVTNLSIGDRTAHIVQFPNLTLQQSGIYRLKVWITPQNISTSPSYFKVPMLPVL